MKDLIEVRGEWYEEVVYDPYPSSAAGTITSCCTECDLPGGPRRPCPMTDNGLRCIKKDGDHVFYRRVDPLHAVLLQVEEAQ